MTSEAPPLQDFVCTEDYLWAICTIWETANRTVEHESVVEMRPYAKEILARVAARLVQKLDRHLFGTRPHMETEQQAIAVLKGLALELQHAGRELGMAAAELKAKGHGMAANRAHIAHKRALAEAGAYLE